MMMLMKMKMMLMLMMMNSVMKPNDNRLVKMGDLVFTDDEWKKCIGKHSSEKEASTTEYHKK
eukprot:10705246-Ditylum_brightwellii.AAC.1